MQKAKVAKNTTVTPSSTLITQCGPHSSWRGNGRAIPEKHSSRACSKKDLLIIIGDVFQDAEVVFRIQFAAWVCFGLGGLGNRYYRGEIGREREKDEESSVRSMSQVAGGGGCL